MPGSAAARRAQLWMAGMTEECCKRVHVRHPGTGAGSGGWHVPLMFCLAYARYAAGGVLEPWEKNFPGKPIGNTETGRLCNDRYLSPGLWKFGFESSCFHRSSTTLGKAPLPPGGAGAALRGWARSDSAPEVGASL